MMLEYSKYPEYKKSNSKMQPPVPSHWVTWKVTHGYGIIGSGTTPKSDNPEYYNGDILWVTTSELRENIIFDTKQKITKKALEEIPSLRIYDTNSIAIAMYGATIGRLGILGKESSVNQACCVFSKPQKFYQKFLFYWLLMSKDTLISLSSGGGQPNLSQEDLKQLRIPIPKVNEQQIISDFLDLKTSQIDKLITEKEKLIALLEEKRTAIITQAVTKGLDPDIEMKDSGIEWLGDVPSDWQVWKATHGFGIIGSGTTPKSDNPDYYDGDIPWVTTSELRESFIIDTKQKITCHAIDDTNLKFYGSGAVIIAMYGATIGRLGILRIPATVNQACCVFDKPIRFHPRFFYYWLWMARGTLISLSAGGGQPNLSQDDLKQLRIPVPPVDSQCEIANYIDTEVSKLNKLSEKIKLSIIQLKEYREALITSAVTGQIDLRNHSSD